MVPKKRTTFSYKELLATVQKLRDSKWVPQLVKLLQPQAKVETNSNSVRDPRKPLANCTTWLKLPLHLPQKE